MLALGLFALLASTARADDTQPPPSDPPPVVTLPAEPDPAPDPAPSVTSKPPRATPTHRAGKRATGAPSSATQLPVRTRRSSHPTLPAATPYRERRLHKHRGALKRTQAATLRPAPASPISGRPTRERLHASPFLKVAAQLHSPSGSRSGTALLIAFALCLAASVALFLVPGVLPRFPVIAYLREWYGDRFVRAGRL